MLPYTANVPLFAQTDSDLYTIISDSPGTLAELAERYIAVVAWSRGKFIPRTSPCLLRQTLTFEPLSLTLAELTERYIAVVDWSRGKFIP